KNTRTLNSHVSSRFGKMMLGARYLAMKNGPLSGSPTLLGVFAKTDPHAPAPDVQIYVSGATSSSFGGAPHDSPGITSSVCILRPEGRGHCHVGSADPAEQPGIRHNYLKEESELDIAVRSVELVRRIVGGAAMSKFSPEEIQPTADVQSRDELISYARDTVYTTFHPVGTC